MLMSVAILMKESQFNTSWLQGVFFCLSRKGFIIYKTKLNVAEEMKGDYCQCDRTGYLYL